MKKENQEQTNILYEKLTQFGLLWRKYKHRRYVNNGILTDTTSGQGRIIALLKMNNGVSIKDMSYLFGVHITTLNELLAKLEKNGYIRRGALPEDKRVTVIFLTEKGKAAELPDEEINPIVSALTPAEQTDFNICLDKIIFALQKDLGIEDTVLKRFEEWKKLKC